MKNKVFVLVGVVVAVVAFAAVAIFTKKGEPVAPPAEESSSAAAPVTGGPTISPEILVRAHSPSLGNAASRVTVVEWFDPECEACKRMHEIFHKIVGEYGARVNFVMRYMTYHQNSLYASAALEEAKEAGKFEQALDLFFEKQPIWGDHHAPKPELLSTYLQQLGIPKAQTGKDYLIKKHGAKIQMDEQDGNQAGVRGTPTFFVNGKMLPQLGEEPLRAAIEHALAGH